MVSATPRLTNYIFMTNSTYPQASPAQPAIAYCIHSLLLPFCSNVSSSICMYYMYTYAYIRRIIQRHGLALYPGMVHSGIIRASIAGGFWIPVMRVGLPICACFNLLATQPTHMALTAGAPASNVRLLI